MKKLLLSIFFGFSCAYSMAQDNYLSASLHPQLGGFSSSWGNGNAQAMSLEFNLGRSLGKGKVFETGLGLRQESIHFRYIVDTDDFAPDGDYLQRSTMLVAPARLRIHLNQRSEGRHQLWLNLGYIYGRRFLADAWITWDDAPETPEEFALLVVGKNYHFAEFGLEMDAPLCKKYRIGLGINYTQVFTGSSGNQYFNSNLQLAGLKIRFARRVWKQYRKPPN